MHRQRQETTLSYLMVVECADAFSLASHISETCCIHNNNPQALIDVTLIAWRLAHAATAEAGNPARSANAQSNISAAPGKSLSVSQQPATVELKIEVISTSQQQTTGEDAADGKCQSI